MSFKNLQIRYQTARSLPAPYAYFYTLSLRPIADTVQVDLAITYPDRDDIDDDELIAEGYTRDDDFAWSGQLPNAWQQTVVDLVNKTRLQPNDEDSLGEDDDYWDLTLEQPGAGPKQGKPANADDWQYLVQELIQATYESTHKEKPFELIYLDSNRAEGDTELRLTASFADRVVHVLHQQQGRKRTETRPWSTLKRVMNAVYSYDYDPDEALAKRPQQEGHWLNLGTDEWYTISQSGALIDLLRKL